MADLGQPGVGEARAPLTATWLGAPGLWYGIAVETGKTFPLPATLEGKARNMPGLIHIKGRRIADHDALEEAREAEERAQREDEAAHAEQAAQAAAEAARVAQMAAELAEAEANRAEAEADEETEAAQDAAEEAERAAQVAKRRRGRASRA